MKKNIISLAVAASLGLVAFAASAEDMYRGAWYLVPGVSVDSNSHVSANTGGGGFIRLGKELSESWDVQMGAGYAQGSNALKPTLGTVNGDYKQTLLSADALYMFSRDKFRPFLLAGLGVAHNDANYNFSNLTNENGKKTGLMGEVGAGLQYLFSDKFGVQADLREVFSRSRYVADFSGTQAVNKQHITPNTYLNLGGIYRFGAPAPVAMAAPEPAPVVAPAPAPAPMAVVEPAPVAPACKPTMETVTIAAEKLFGFDKANLKDEGKASLDDAAAKIKANPDVELVMVTGHTDRIGSDKYNQKLSERRANQVKDYLVSQGVDASRLQAVGKGEAEPVAACTGVAGKKLIACLAPNRRVVLSAEKTRESGCK